MYKNIYLRPGKDQSLKRFHPWVFSGAIQRTDKGIAEGDIVRVVSAGNECIGVGHYQKGSIAVRMLCFGDQEITPTFWQDRLEKALALRRSIGIIREDNTMYRLVHGEGDHLPGLIIDIYDAQAIIQAHSIGMHRQRTDICEALRHVMGPALTAIYYKSEQTLPPVIPDIERSGYLWGKAEEVDAIENGLKFRIDWFKGQKTGFFLDQRDNRALLGAYSKGRKVLNMFCYTGGFSVYALRGGAREVVSVDSSERAIEVTDMNVKMNFPDCQVHRSVAEDAFQFLNTIDDSYDLIILDPPAFAKHRDALHNALKGYTRLNLRALQKIRKGGILFTFSCSQAVNKDQFRLAVMTAAAQSHRTVRILHQLHQPADHPINIFHPEGEYLKGLVLYVE